MGSEMPAAGRSGCPGRPGTAFLRLGAEDTVLGGGL